MANTVKVGDGEDAEVFICILATDPLTYPDNVVDKCSMCGRAIQHRPVYPKTPPKVCLPCILPKLEEEAELGELNMQVTPRTLDEIKDWRKKGLN